jgi:hypothetical protein
LLLIPRAAVLTPQAGHDLEKFVNRWFGITVWQGCPPRVEVGDSMPEG